MTVFATAAFAACGSDDDKSSADESTEEADEAEDAESSESYEIVSDAAVATGYADLLQQMTLLSADPGSADEAKLDEVHETWESFEGTIKQNDADAYLASEEALDSFLEAGADGDGAAMTAATSKMATTSAAYLAAHPG